MRTPTLGTASPLSGAWPFAVLLFLLVGAHSLLETARDSLFPGVRSLLIHPSVIFYRIAGADIEIVRVVDGRRNLAAIFRDDPGG